MIKPIEVSPINTSKRLCFECSKCGERGTIFLENSLVNTDQEGRPIEPLEYTCEGCGADL